MIFVWLAECRQRTAVEGQNKENDGENVTSTTPLLLNSSSTTQVSKSVSSESTSHQSFLQDHTPVRGVQDIIGRMRAGDQQIQAGNLFFLSIPFQLWFWRKFMNVCLYIYIISYWRFSFDSLRVNWHDSDLVHISNGNFEFLCQQMYIACWKKCRSMIKYWK